jgi:hypothetical protein
MLLYPIIAGSALLKGVWKGLRERPESASAAQAREDASYEPVPYETQNLVFGAAALIIGFMWLMAIAVGERPTVTAGILGLVLGLDIAALVYFASKSLHVQAARRSEKV